MNGMYHQFDIAQEARRSLRIPGATRHFSAQRTIPGEHGYTVPNLSTGYFLCVEYVQWDAFQCVPAYRNYRADRQRKRRGGERWEKVRGKNGAIVTTRCPISLILVGIAYVGFTKV